MRSFAFCVCFVRAESISSLQKRNVEFGMPRTDCRDEREEERIAHERAAWIIRRVLTETGDYSRLSYILKNTLNKTGQRQFPAAIRATILCGVHFFYLISPNECVCELIKIEKDLSNLSSKNCTHS